MRKKLLLVLISAIAVVAFAIPVLAAPADIEGTYIAKIPSYSAIFDNNGVRCTLPFRYFGFDITQEDDVVAGLVYGLNVSSVAGCKAQAGTAAYNATVVGYTGWSKTKALVFGTNTLNVTATGLVGAYLKSGCEGTAANGTGTLVGSPVTLATGWNSLNVSATGTITISLNMEYVVIGALAGTMGSSRFSIAGPTLPTWLDAGNATVTGVTNVCADNQTRIFAPGGIFAVTGDGDITITMPVGTTGNVTGDSLTLDGEASLNLTAGENEITIAGQPGTFTVNLQLWEEYQFNGRATTSWWSGKTRLSGTLIGYLVLDQSPWNGKLLNLTIRASESTQTIPN